MLAQEAIARRNYTDATRERQIKFQKTTIDYQKKGVVASLDARTKLADRVAFLEVLVSSPFLASGGLDQNRGNAEALRKYWTHGEGALKIMWGVTGDFTRCVEHMSEYLGDRAHGYCALRHRDTTGFWPHEKKGH
jgi:hypothetical protein